MRSVFVAALLLITTATIAQDVPKPLSIAIEPLGDGEHGVVTRVFFRFANPRAITEAGLFLEGSFVESGHVPRNFRYAVPRRDDKFAWEHTTSRNGKVVRRTRWTLLPDQRNELSTIHTFAEGNAEISVRLVLEGDFGSGPVLVSKTSEVFAIAKTNRTLPVEAEEEVVEERDAPEFVAADTGAVGLRVAPSEAGEGRFVANVDARPPVTRVEFRVGEKKVLARNKPPYLAEFDLSDAPKEGVTLRAIGFDGAGRYVDADAFVVRERDELTVTITRTTTPDGFTHLKLSVRKPRGVALKRVVLHAGDETLHEWERPPFALTLPSGRLEDVPFLRATVADEAGSEATDLLQLRTAR